MDPAPVTFEALERARARARAAGQAEAAEELGLGPNVRRPVGGSRGSGLFESCRPQSLFVLPESTVGGAGCHEGCTVSGRKTVLFYSYSILILFYSILILF